MIRQVYLIKNACQGIFGSLVAEKWDQPEQAFQNLGEEQSMTDWDATEGA